MAMIRYSNFLRATSQYVEVATMNRVFWARCQLSLFCQMALPLTLIGYLEPESTHKRLHEITPRFHLDNRFYTLLCD